MSEIPGVPKDGSAVDPMPTQASPDPRVEAERQRLLGAAGVTDAVRPTSARELAGPPPDWHNLPFWLMVAALFLGQIQTVGLVESGTTMGKWFLVALGFVNAMQYAIARGKIRGTR